MKKLSLLVLTISLFSCFNASAQFREEAFSQQYNSDQPSKKDSTDKLFSLKNYFGGLSHKEELKIGTMFGGSAVFIGGCQIYNEQYWKLPIVYGTIAGSAGAGLILNSRGKSDAAKYCFVAAGISYWATLMDGVINYGPVEYPHAGKAALYSLLLPGLGQIYNKEYWKLPIYLGGMGFAIHYHSDCTRNFNRFRDIYLKASDPATASSVPLSAEQALYYKNVYRRYRDYAVLSIALLYLLQVIDANVFSYMHGFEVDDDLALRIEPTVISPNMQLVSSGGVANYSESAFPSRAAFASPTLSFSPQGSKDSRAMQAALGLKIAISF